ncbi:MAG TPA: molybdenum cofactor guanylyltransferase [Chthoniobacterales bacterium]
MNIAAALIAGGESRRLGQDKALITLGDGPLWRRQLDLLRRLNPAEIFVSARTDPQWCPAGIEFVPDVKPSRGPLSGLTACLKRAESPHLLVLAVDMPFMTEDYLRHICGNIAPGIGVIPMINDRAEPLSAVYLRESLPEFMASLATDDFSLQSIVRRLISAGKLRPLAVAPEQVALFRSVNEPADLRDMARVAS